jgi:hypothetical protein
VHVELRKEVVEFLNPQHLFSSSEVLGKPSSVPATDGVYGWWFRSLPAKIDISGCQRHHGHTLLYVGISPKRPPANGRAPSKQKWMATNGFVSWVVRNQPWELEDELILKLDLPLNLEGNQRNAFHATLTQARARCLAAARAG